MTIIHPDDAIAAFGGKAQLAAAVGASRQLIHQWETKGRIPRWWQDDVRSAAQARKIKLRERVAQ